MILKDKYSSGRPPSPLSRDSAAYTAGYTYNIIIYTCAGDGVPAAVEIPRYI